MQSILTLTENGLKFQELTEKTFLVIDAKEFLQTLFENLLQEKVTTLDKNVATLISSAATLFKEEYEMNLDANSDLVNLFYSINPQNIIGQTSLLEAHEQSVQLKSLVNSNFLNEEEQRIICLSFFNDTNLTSKIEQSNDVKTMQNLEKLSLNFKKNIKEYLKKSNSDNKQINSDLYRPYPKKELPVFDALLNDLIYNISVESSVTKAYKTSQNLIPVETQNKKQKISSLLKPDKMKNFSSFGDK